MISMRENFTLYYDFYNVARFKSFSKASNELYISQSTLSRNINKLEGIRNTRLFNRLISGVELTKEGKELFLLLDDLFANIENSSILNKNIESTAKIVIGTTENIMNFYLPKVLINFCKEYPQIKFEIITTDSHTLLKKIELNEIDIIFDYLPISNINDEKFTITPVDSFETIFACTKKYYHDNKDNLNDFKNLKYIIPGSSRRRQLLDEWLRLNNIVLTSYIELPNSKLMKDLVLNDFGIGYFIKNDVVKLLDNELIEIKEFKTLPQNTIGMIYSNRYRNLTENIFIQYLLKTINAKGND